MAADSAVRLSAASSGEPAAADSFEIRVVPPRGPDQPLTDAQREAWRRARQDNRAAARPLPLTQLANQLANDPSHLLYDVPYSALRHEAALSDTGAPQATDDATMAGPATSASPESSSTSAGLLPLPSGLVTLPASPAPAMPTPWSAARPPQRQLTQAQIDLLETLFAAAPGRVTVAQVLETIRDNPTSYGILHDLNFAVVMRKLTAFRQNKPLGPAMPAAAAVARDLELQVQAVLVQEAWRQAQSETEAAHEAALALPDVSTEVLLEELPEAVPQAMPERVQQPPSPKAEPEQQARSAPRTDTDTDTDNEVEPEFTFDFGASGSAPELDPRFSHLHNVDPALFGLRGGGSAYL